MATAVILVPVIVNAADYTLAAPAPATVSAGTTGMVTIHVAMTPPNNAAGTKAAPTGFMTVVRQGDSDPIWCYPNAGTLCYTGSLVNGGVDVHVYMTKLAASAGTLLFQLRDPSTKVPYSNALAVPIKPAVTNAVPAQAAPMWTFDVAVDATDVLSHGYTAAELGLFVECSVSGTNKPGVETGAGYVKHVPVASGGVTTVKVAANPTIYYAAGVPSNYSCLARIGWIDENPYFNTAGGPATGVMTTSPIETKPIVLTFINGAPKKKKLPLTVTPPHPTGPVTSPPKNKPPR